MDVTVLHVMPTLMERQLDPAAGYLLQKAVEARGIKVITKANTKAILGNGKVEGVELADGTRHPGDARRHGRRHPAQRRPGEGRRARGQSRHRRRRPACTPPTRPSSRSANAPRSAARSTASSRRSTRWRALRAAQLAGDASAAFVHADTPTKLKVTGIDLFSLGDFADGDDREEIVLRDAAAGVYKRAGAARTTASSARCSIGETADGAWFNDLKKKGDRHLARCATR